MSNARTGATQAPQLTASSDTDQHLPIRCRLSNCHDQHICCLTAIFDWPRCLHIRDDGPSPGVAHRCAGGLVHRSGHRLEHWLALRNPGPRRPRRSTAEPAAQRGDNANPDRLGGQPTPPWIRPSRHRGSPHETLIRATLAVTSMGMAYMLIAMQFGTTPMTSMPGM